MMLNWLRQRQVAIASGTIAIFLGSLFSLFCQHCLAEIEQVQPAVIAGHDGDGHCPQHGTDEPAPQPMKPCMGVCDCGDAAMLIADKHSITLSDNKAYPEIKVTLAPVLYHEDYTPRRLPWLIGKPHKPDRACDPPLERNCVLLI